MIIKICGLTTLTDAQLAKDCGADWLGFIFAPSRRQITPQAARDITAQLTGCTKVGVFVDCPVAQVQEIAAYCQLDIVQLHGQENENYRRQLGLPHIKVFSLSPDGQTLHQPWPADADWILLDTAVKGQSGGTGVPFTWSQAVERCRNSARPILAAGGLTEANVADAIRSLQPFGVDVAGGVETEGRKDGLKLERFIRAARQAAKEVEHVS
ncbi:phosphoribosylanthranilate isomerase [Azotosporobacter soli]|uniref:phosphoribosylanthranilate isomerase n=1 Tax=Azotosporobacter soli TaxID=3055040 RepID=UPI0031FF112E